MWLRAALSFLSLLLIGCGIDGEPVAPAQKVKKLEIVPKLSETDPMVSEGDEAIQIIPLTRINRLGADYGSHFTAEIHDLEEMFEILKPASAQPRKRPVESLE